MGVAGVCEAVSQPENKVSTKPTISSLEISPARDPIKIAHTYTYYSTTDISHHPCNLPKESHVEYYFQRKQHPTKESLERVNEQ